MNYLLISLNIGLFCAVFGSLGLGFYFIKKTQMQLELIKQFHRKNTEEIANVTKEVEKIAEHNKSSTVTFQKMSEHQRVLLASLNRQLMKLEEIFVEASLNKSAESISVPEPEKPKKVAQKPPAPTQSVAIPTEKSDPRKIPLASLFSNAPVKRFDSADREVLSRQRAQVMKEQEAFMVPADPDSMRILTLFSGTDAADEFEEQHEHRRISHG